MKSKIERLAVLEQKMDDHCKNNDKDLSELKDGQVRIENKLDTALDRKANKWVETAFWWVITILAVSNAVAIYLATIGR